MSNVLPVETENVTATLDAAMSAAMVDIKRLEKLHKNQHGGYQFASVDDFKDEIRPLIAKHGLWVHSNEVSFELLQLKISKDEKTYAKISFEYRVHHISGSVTDATRFTVCLPYTGAQTSGAAQSYALKEGVYKGLFQASSGDLNEEADMQEQVQLTDHNRLGKADAKPLWEALQKEMREIETVDRNSAALADWWKNNQDQLAMLPLDWFAMIKKEYADTWRKLKANEDADAKGGPQ
jgi:hypothetical protein